MDNPFPEHDPHLFVITPEGNTFLTTSWENTQDVIRDINERGYMSYHNRHYNRLHVTNDINEQQCVNVTVWGDSLPSLTEFYDDIYQMKKIKGSESILKELAELRILLTEYYTDDIHNLENNRKDKQ